MVYTVASELRLAGEVFPGVAEASWQEEAGKPFARGGLRMRDKGPFLGSEGQVGEVFLGYQGAAGQRLAVQLFPEECACCYRMADVLREAGRSLPGLFPYSGSLRGLLEGMKTPQWRLGVVPEVELVDWQPDGQNPAQVLQELEQLFGLGLGPDLGAGTLVLGREERPLKVLEADEVLAVRRAGFSSVYRGLEVLVPEAGGSLQRTFRGREVGPQCRLFRPEVAAGSLEQLADALVGQVLAGEQVRAEVLPWLGIASGDRVVLPLQSGAGGEAWQVLAVTIRQGEKGLAKEVLLKKTD